MAIFKGSTPTITIVLRSEDVDFSTLAKVYLAFAQKGTVLSGMEKSWESFDDYISADGKTLKLQVKLTQAETKALTEDVDLDCQVDVLTTEGDRKISKTYSFGICKAFITRELT